MTPSNLIIKYWNQKSNSLRLKFIYESTKLTPKRKENIQKRQTNIPPLFNKPEVLPSASASFKMLILDWGSYIVSIAKIGSEKIGAWIHSMKFFLPSLLFASTNLLCGLAWNTVVISGLLLLTATWGIC